MITLPGISSNEKYTFSELSKRRMCRPDLRHKHVQDQRVSLVVTSVSNPQSQNVFLSQPPFILWHTPVVDYNVISLLYDNEKDAVIAIKTSKETGYNSLSVTECNHSMGICSAQQTAYQSFTFPETFQPHGMILHPQHYALYVYGSQVWLSLDGGNYFTQIISLSDNEMIVSSISNYYSDSILFVSNKHRLFYGKAGLNRLTLIMQLVEHSSIVLDYLRNPYIVTWSSTQSQLQVTLMNVDAYIEQSHHPIMNTTLAFHPANYKEVFLYNYDDKTRTTFNKGNVWQIIIFGNGGKILIVSVENVSPNSVFTTRLRGFVLTPLKYEKRITMNNIIMVPITSAKYNILFTNDTEFTWSNDDIGKTLVCPGCCTILITTFMNTSHVQGYSVYWSQSRSKHCYLYNLGDWYLSEEECQHIMIPDKVISTNPVVYLDHGDQRTFSVSAIRKGQVHSTTKSLSVMVSNTKLITVVSRTVHDYNGYETVHITVSNIMYITGTSTVTVYLYQSSPRCQQTSFTVTVLCTCPPTKRLAFVYPFHISKEDYLHGNPVIPETNRKLLYDLEVNYRPPSKYGIAIPTSENVYNVDPSQAIPRNAYRISKVSWKYKQCAGKSSKDECLCTDEMKLSNLASYSDCKQRVYRVRQSESMLKLKFKILDDDKEIILTEPHVIFIEEINGRQDFFTKSKATNSLNKMMKNQRLVNRTEYLNPTQITIIMEGSGLYHFKATIMKGFSYCQLEDEFQVFLDGAVLPYPLQMIVIITMSVVIGGALFVIYLWYLHNHHTHRVRKIGSRCQEIK
ncbi:cation channel sperm-associated auxiliary subunit beta-like [Saccoglossus kowalevskii]